MEIQVKVFGQTAKDIKPGDFFIPEFESVEGRDVVTLVKNNAISDLLKKYDNSEIGLDSIINYLRDLTGEKPDGS